MVKTDNYIEQEFYNKRDCINAFCDDWNSKPHNFKRVDESDIIKWTFEDVYKFVNSVSVIIKDRNYNGVYGIPRGGLLLALLVSFKTGLPLLSSAVDGCLVIDDACNTGVALLPYINRFDTAVMWLHEDSPVEPTYYYIKTSKVVRFPWQ